MGCKLILITRRSNGQKTVGCFTPFTILANNFLPLNVALAVQGYMFHLIRNNELEIQLDVTGATDRLPSVAFDIIVSWNMPFQKVNFTAKECWIECSVWDKFQDSILELQEQDSGSITLVDLSENPLISFTKLGAELVTEIQSKDSLGVGSFTLKSTSRSIELSEIYNKMQQLDKWW